MDIKVYVEVNASFNEDGLMIPKSLVWEDDTTCHIDKVIYSSKGQQTCRVMLSTVGLLKERLYNSNNAMDLSIALFYILPKHHINN